MPEGSGRLENRWRFENRNAGTKAGSVLESTPHHEWTVLGAPVTRMVTCGCDRVAQVDRPQAIGVGPKTGPVGKPVEV